MSKKQSIKKTFNNTRYMLNLIWKTKKGKSLIIVKIINSFINSIFPIVLAVFPGLIINELTGNKNVETIALYVGILVLSPFVKQIYSYIIGKQIQKLSLSVSLQMEIDFFNHVARMDYESVENPDIQILSDRAGSTIGQSLNVLNQFCSLLLSIFSLSFISTIVVSLNYFLIGLILIIILLNSMIKKKSNNKKFEISKKLSEYDRYQGAYVYMLEHSSYAKEKRLFDCNDFLVNMYRRSKDESNKTEVKFSSEQNKPFLFNSFTNFIQMLIVYVYLIYLVIEKNMLIGTMTIYLTTVSQFSSYFNNVFNSYLNLSSISLNIQELRKFLNIPNKQEESGKDIPITNENSIIEFKNVSFKYPGSKIYALQNLNLKFKFSEKLCIVGANGSGKTTFIKLLTRLYFPSEGEMLLDGVNINTFDYKSYQKLFSPVFQDFVTYSTTLEKNITLEDNGDMNCLNDTIEKSGLTTLVNKLPKEAETQVGKWLDEEGFEPSGGEEQKIAIARALYHEREVYILDEPTAALDPDAEYEIYTQFGAMIKGKPAILITHRLSAVQLADKVAVFDSGKVIEYGTHKELCAANGKYKEMYEKQSKFYVKYDN